MYKIFFDGDGFEYTDFLFETEDDAEFYLSLNGSSELKCNIKEVPIFVRKFWYNLIPYVSWFDEKHGTSIVNKAKPHDIFGMMDSQFSFITFNNRNLVMVAFWDATKDIDQATILAKSLYEGWKAAQNA